MLNGRNKSILDPTTLEDGPSFFCIGSSKNTIIRTLKNRQIKRVLSVFTIIGSCKSPRQYSRPVMFSSEFGLA